MAVAGVERVSWRERRDKVTDALALPAIRRVLATIWRKVGLTRTGQVALIASVFPWIAARLIAGTTLYVLSYGTLAAVLSAAFLTPRRLRLHAERTGLRPRAQQGDRLEVEITVRAERGLSSFHLQEHVPERLGHPLRVPIGKVRSGETVTYSYSLHCARRGSYLVGPLVAITSDPIGVAQRETVLAEPFELLVHPKVLPAAVRPLTRLHEDPPIRPPVSRPWPSGMEFYGMREWHRGDDLRRVVWRATARTGTLMVSEAEQGITDHLTLVLDTDRGSHSREGDLSESFEYAVSAVASLGVRHLTDGYEVNVVTGGGRLVRPLRGAAQTLLLLDALARVQTDRHRLSDALRNLVADPRRDAQLILVASRLHRDDLALLKLLMDRGVNITLIAVVWDETHADDFSSAAALGCQVVAAHPGEDLSAALNHDVRAVRRA